MPGLSPIPSGQHQPLLTRVAFRYYAIAAELDALVGTALVLVLQDQQVAQVKSPCSSIAAISRLIAISSCSRARSSARVCSPSGVASHPPWSGVLAGGCGC